MMGMILVCLLPQIFFEASYAHPFNITAFSKSVDYEFTSLDYASEFAALNHQSVPIMVEGVPIARREKSPGE